MPIIISSPPATSLALEFDPAEENSGSPLALSEANFYGLTLFQCPAPSFRHQWASSVDSEGAALVGAAQPDNRQITIGLDISGDNPLYALQAKLGKLHREGGTLRYTNSAGVPIVFDVRTHDGWAPEFDHLHYLGGVTKVQFTSTCDPYGRGPEVALGDHVETTLPALIFTEASIPGDAPALGRLVIDNDAGAQNYGTLIAGVQSRYYSASADAALLFQAESCSLSAPSEFTYSGTVAAGPAGASGSSVIQHLNVTTTGQNSFSLGASGTPSHIGTFRVWARVQAPNTNAGTVSLALGWRSHVGAPFKQEPWKPLLTTTGTPIEAAWIWVNLGLVTLPPVVAGTQQWNAIFRAKSTDANDDVYWDAVAVVPASERYAEITDEVTPILGFGTVYSNRVGAGQSVHWRHDGAYTQEGSLYRRDVLIGNHLLVSPSGAEARTLRVFAMFAGSRLGSGYAEGILPSPAIDDISARLHVVPRYLVVPEP